MRDSIVSLIQKYNSPKQGLKIDVELDVYAQKLVDNAIILTYYNQGLKAFIAFYANNYITKEAFLSLILVGEDLRGQGIAYELLNSSINILKSRGFKAYNLEVLKSNDRAIKFYENLNFKIIDDSQKFYKMSLSL